MKSVKMKITKHDSFIIFQIEKIAVCAFSLTVPNGQRRGRDCGRHPYGSLHSIMCGDSG